MQIHAKNLIAFLLTSCRPNPSDSKRVGARDYRNLAAEFEDGGVLGGRDGLDAEA